MPEIGLKALKNEASQVIEAVEGGARYVVTKRGRPAAVILSMREAEVCPGSRAGIRVDALGGAGSTRRTPLHPA
jgi:prevent-host-death family protein